ncbi:hypothetical protein FKM82_002500 [Ascaphus truei]
MSPPPHVCYHAWQSLGSKAPTLDLEHKFMGSSPPKTKLNTRGTFARLKDGHLSQKCIYLFFFNDLYLIFVESPSDLIA